MSGPEGDLHHHPLLVVLVESSPNKSKTLLH